MMPTGALIVKHFRWADSNVFPRTRKRVSDFGMRHLSSEFFSQGVKSMREVIWRLSNEPYIRLLVHSLGDNKEARPQATGAYHAL